MRRPAVVIRGDARALPLPDESVDLIVTSPPYFALRSYTDGGQAYAEQIGSEATPAAYIAALVDCTREWMRVLKPTGSLFVNLGDKYNSPASGQNLRDIDTRRASRHGHARGPNAKRYDDDRRTRQIESTAPKSLLGLPWRYALACVDQLGLILRAEIVWSKPNGLPESVTDRVRRSHEQWFHLTRQPRYYSAVDEIREPHAGPWKSPGSGMPGKAIGPADRDGHSQWDRTREQRDATARHPLGKLPGSVWEIPSEPLRVPDHLGVSHFAAFPTEWPRRLILGWSPPGICTECGEGRQPEVLRERAVGMNPTGPIWGRNGKHSLRTGRQHAERSAHAITGYACGCPEPTAPTRPAIVLDPFGGTGTTALVASTLGRIGITVDRSGDYCRLARWRTSDPGERARAMRVPKPPEQVDGQPALFDLGAVAA